MRHFRRLAGLSALTLALAPLAGASAQSPVDPNVKAEDIPMQPLRDLNIDSEDVPPLLFDIGNDPYATGGLTSCHHIEQAIADIDLMLGADIDDPQERSDLQKGANSAGRIASSVVGGIIPFRGIVREISGAKGKERRLRVMVNAAMVRRGFLKGIGLARGCAYPARPIVDVETGKASADLPEFPEPGTYEAPFVREKVPEGETPPGTPKRRSTPRVQDVD
ncbi:hypothetical protein [Croceicoccus gelatinilyticus]|uniref:hypothetical protein n=1 Tax=Croceicoccus gelatinilyticus TaxID=2835536 RepID=UPI001BCB7298|nr:hypothetical protein [Croceicoccus gelatinilyticus]MBS7670466.1 hypothetical protein [Croceicoccus gelatinilyticus]